MLDILLFPGETVAKVSLGGSHSSAITSTGRIFTWGNNTCGQLGDGTITGKSTPVEILHFNLGVGETITEVALEIIIPQQLPQMVAYLHGEIIIQAN